MASLNLNRGKPLQVVGVMNALVALLAKEAGFEALYLSGASISSAQFGLPDLGVLTLNDIVEEAKRIIHTVDLPLIVDIDNGWNHPLMLDRAAVELSEIGVAAVQIEDQRGIKRCGHLPIKELVSKDEMAHKIELLKQGGLTVLARTDALGLEGLEKTLERVLSYKKAGADMIFLEAVTHQTEIDEVKKASDLPLLINLTEFGKTPLWTLDELKNVDLVLYPMTINRVLYQAAKDALRILKNEGSQKSLLPKMMTREELYQLIHYREKEAKV